MYDVCMLSVEPTWKERCICMMYVCMYVYMSVEPTWKERCADWISRGEAESIVRSGNLSVTTRHRIASSASRTATGSWAQAVFTASCL